MAEYKRYAVFESYRNDDVLLRISCTLDIDTEIVGKFPKHDHNVHDLDVHVICSVRKSPDTLNWVVLLPYDKVRQFHLEQILKRWNEWTNYPMAAYQDRLYHELMNASAEPEFKGTHFTIESLAVCLKTIIGDGLFKRKQGTIWNVLERSPSAC